MALEFKVGDYITALGQEGSIGQIVKLVQPHHMKVRWVSPWYHITQAYIAEYFDTWARILFEPEAILLLLTVDSKVEDDR